MTYEQILKTIAVPRPNQSEALEKTAAFIKDTFAQWDVPFTVQTFTLRPYMHALVGLACVICAAVLLISIIKKKTVPALIAALAIPLLLVLEIELFVPVVSALVQKGGENIVVHFNVPNAVREIIFSAHYDSKTDFWDHIQRARIYRFLPLFIVLGFLASLWAAASGRYVRLADNKFRIAVNIIASLYFAYMCLVALNLGGYVFLKGESSGAVDNGTSVTALMELAHDLREGNLHQGKSNITILFTAGEEVNFQGAISYLRKYPGKKEVLPAYLVNLELIAQGGTMIYWKKSGVFLKYYPADEGLVRRMGAAWKNISGNDIGTEDQSADDSVPFIKAGIPAITIGFSGMPGTGMGGFHSPADNMKRVHPEQIPMTVSVLKDFIQSF